MNDDVLMIPLAAILMPLVLVPTILVLKHVARRREWQHRERMAALQAGHPVPRSDAWPALAAIAIGAVVPLGAVFFAWMASLTTHAREEPWTAAGFIGVVAVWCGHTLAVRLLDTRAAERAALDARAHGKPPAYDPDAFDVVGRRG